MKVNNEIIIDILGCIPTIGAAVGIAESIYYVAKMIHSMVQQYVFIKEYKQLLTEWKSRNCSLYIKFHNDKMNGFKEILENYETLISEQEYLQLNATEKQKLFLQSVSQWKQMEIREQVEISEKNESQMLEKLNKNIKEIESTIFSELDTFPADLLPNIEIAKMLNERICAVDEKFKKTKKDINDYSYNAYRGLLRTIWIGGIGIALYHRWKVLDLSHLKNTSIQTSSS
jgi:hypothetical protein